MKRNLLVGILVIAALLGTGSTLVLGRKSVNSGIKLTVPATLQAGVSDAVKVRLPAGVAAADGRIFFDTSAVELIGIAPVGKGTALSTVDINGGVAFGAYGLAAKNGETAFNLVVVALRDGHLRFRVVVDSAADASGHRFTLSNSQALGAVTLGRGLASLAAPRSAAKLMPLRAAGKLRDVVRDGVVSKLDLDALRLEWERAHSSDKTCGALGSEADANGDGCVDIVDLQAAVAAQGQLVAGGTPTATALADSGRLTAAAIAPNAPAFTVTSTADNPDTNPGDGLCRDSQGNCTLRAAVTEANWSRGENRILFNLQGTAPVVIQLSSSRAAPLIQDRTGGVLIDGYSQPGSQVNTAANGSNAIMGVEIRGTQGSPRSQAFFVTSANNVFRGISFTSSYRPLFFDGVDAHHNEVLGNFFGFTRTGAVESYRGNHGVHLHNGAHHNIVGTPALADRNVIGSYSHAIDFYGPGTDNNVVHNNMLCMTPSGMSTAICSTGIDHNFGPKSNIEGGLGTNEGNVIGPTTLNGIEISHGWDPDRQDTTTKWQCNNNQVIGNWVGFRGDGSYSSAFRSAQNNPGGGDNGNGLNAYDGSNNNLFEGNYIASAYDGIQFMSPNATGNTARNNIIGESPLGQDAPLGRYGINVRNNARSHVIEGNRISNTANHGIALIQRDILWIRISRNIITDTSADAIFMTAGANNNTAVPVITTATTIRAAGTGIRGATVEVYEASRNAGQSGLPVEFLGSGVVANDGTWSVPIVVSAGQRVTALQITPVNNTSRLSTNVAAVFEAPPSAPEASFNWSQRASTLTVDFTDTSTNTPAQWLWNFGDGTTSTERNPVKTYAQAGQYNVSLNVTNAGGSDSVSHQVTVQALPAGVTVAADAFGRTRSGWGSADVGGAYTLQGTLADYNVGNGAATMRIPSAGGVRSALLNTTSQRDVDIRFRVALNKNAAGGAHFVYAVARRNTNNEYRPRIVFNANGTVSVNASVLVNGNESVLGTAVVVPGLSQAPNQFIWLRARVTGASPTTVSVKAWADGQQEPANWQFTATSSQAAVQVAGSVGLRTYLGGQSTAAPVVVSFDDYSVVAAQ